MSQHSSAKRLTAPALMAMKGQQKITCLTAYTAPMAKLLDEQIDILLVGDSLGMVLYGMESTLPVSMAMMIAHGKAVAAHAKRAFVMVDMPFASYQQSPEHAFKNAARIMQQTGCQAVKLEGGQEMLATVAFLTQRGIPVMAHIGLRPQNVNSMGGYRYQGRDAASAKAQLADALAFEQAGAFGLLLEGMGEQTAAKITARVNIPTIGIGASPACDGQVLVTEDMLGLFESAPRFVKAYSNQREAIRDAVTRYAGEVRGGEFPADAHCLGLKKD